MAKIWNLTGGLGQPEEFFHSKQIENENFAKPEVCADGSDRARLAAMRQHKNKCKSQTSEFDFWARIHSDDAPLARERKSIQHGMQHWFLASSGDGQTRHQMRSPMRSAMAELRTLWSENEKSILTLEYEIEQTPRRFFVIDGKGHC